MKTPRKTASVAGSTVCCKLEFTSHRLKRIFFTLLLSVVLSAYTFGQKIQTVGVNTNAKETSTKGVSISPAHFNLSLNPGDTKTYKINVDNTTNFKKQFEVNVYDFNMNGKGKSNFMAAGEGKYSLSKWLNISPTFIELKPREKKEIAFSITVPTSDDGFKSAWSIIMVEEQKPRVKLDDNQNKNNTIALGIVPTFAFGVFIYQNPPNVSVNGIEITNFSFDNTSQKKSIFIEAQNKGNGIAYCTSYIDLTNIDTGLQQRLKVKRFTILPDLIRTFVFELPEKMPRGNYLAVGVLDYGSSEEIQAAKLEFKLE